MSPRILISAAIIVVGAIAVADVVTLVIVADSRFTLLPQHGTLWGLYALYLGMLNLPIAAAFRWWDKGSGPAVTAFWVAMISAAVSFLGWFWVTFYLTIRQL